MKLTSFDIQKDIVSVIAVESIKFFVKEIGNALFSILVDESCDISAKEQMVIVVDLLGFNLNQFYFEVNKYLL